MDVASELVSGYGVYRMRLWLLSYDARGARKVSRLRFGHTPNHGQSATGVGQSRPITDYVIGAALTALLVIGAASSSLHQRINVSCKIRGHGYQI